MGFVIAIQFTYSRIDAEEIKSWEPFRKTGVVGQIGEGKHREL